MGNVMYGVELLGLPKEEARATAKRFVELVGLEGFAESYPSSSAAGCSRAREPRARPRVDPEVLPLTSPSPRSTAQTREDDAARVVAHLESDTQDRRLHHARHRRSGVPRRPRESCSPPDPDASKEILKVDIPRPRDLRVKRDPRFVEIETRIWESIREEAARDTLAATA
jgi:NitT/TauT family transport system ATP-binding protein